MSYVLEEKSLKGSEKSVNLPTKVNGNLKTYQKLLTVAHSSTANRDILTPGQQTNSVTSSLCQSVSDIHIYRAGPAVVAQPIIKTYICYIRW